MTEAPNPRNRTPLILGLAVVCGLIAGGAYLALTGGFGNDDDFDDIALATSEDQYEVCEANAQKFQSLSDYMVGEVAALIMPDEALPVSWLSFLDAKDQPASVADYHGKVVLLNLWATWCAPCREEMPALNALQQELGGDQFQVLTVNVDTGGMEKPIEFVNEIGVLDLPLAHDSTMQIFNDLKSEGRALGMPVTMLIDRNGCEIATINGPAEWASADAIKLIEATLKATEFEIKG